MPHGADTAKLLPLNMRKLPKPWQRITLKLNLERLMPQSIRHVPLNMKSEVTQPLNSSETESQLTTMVSSSYVLFSLSAWQLIKKVLLHIMVINVSFAIKQILIFTV